MIDLYNTMHGDLSKYGICHHLNPHTMPRAITDGKLNDFKGQKCVRVEFDTDDDALLSVCQYARAYDTRLFFYDKWQDGVAATSATASRLGLPMLNPAAHGANMARVAVFLSTTGARAHFGAVASKTALDAALYAKRVADVSFDVPIWHLWLDETALDDFDVFANMFPPLPSINDKIALRDALYAGQIDAVSSLSTTISLDDKNAPFGDSIAGIDALDFYAPLVCALHLDDEFVRAIIHDNPAKILGVDNGDYQAPASNREVLDSVINCYHDGMITTGFLYHLAKAIDVHGSV